MFVDFNQILDATSIPAGSDFAARWSNTDHPANGATTFPVPSRIKLPRSNGFPDPGTDRVAYTPGSPALKGVNGLAVQAFTINIT